MGKPIPKRFFGNENTGDTGNTKDNYTRGGYDGVSGKGLVSLDFSSDRGLFLAPITITMPAPKDTAGKTAVLGPVYITVASVTTGAGKAGLIVGDTYTLAGTGGLVATVASTSGSNATFTVTNAGSGILMSAFPTGGTNGYTQGITLTKASGSGAGTFLVDIVWHLRDNIIATTDHGEGYDGTETVTLTGAGKPASVTAINFTAPSGTPYTEDAFLSILINANTTGNGSKVGTIRRQKNSHRFYVSTSDGSAICTLQTSSPSSAGQMTLIATDSSGKTYYVTKITRHMVTLKQYGSSGWQFADNSRAQWVLDTAVSGVSVKLQSA